MRVFASVCFSAWALAGFAVPAFAEDPTFDLSIEATGATDGFDSGITYTDHGVATTFSLTPSYGIFYATLYGENLDYGSDIPPATVKLSAGMTPTFGDLSVDFNLQRRYKLQDPASDRWLPYVTGTYVFSDILSTSAGVGYYAFDDKDSSDFVELYGALDLTVGEGILLHGETSYDINSEVNDINPAAGNNDYLELIGSITVPLPQRFEALAKVGFENYLGQTDVASYVWYDLGLAYNVSDHVALAVTYHGNDLGSGADCDTQAYTDCDERVVGSFTLKGSLSEFSK